MGDTAQKWLSGEIVTTGSELLLGQIVDTNAAWMAQRLNEIGIHLYYKSTVGDNEQRLSELLGTCIQRSEVVIVTGGLGPTADDITRQALARAVGVPLRPHEPTLEALRKRFSNWGTQMTANNSQQALLPEGAELVPNPVGTAPGIRVQSGECTLFALPGVPREMKRMMSDHVIPFLRELTGGQGVIQTRTLRTIGIGESMLDHELGDLLQSENPTVGLAAHTGQADVRITARGLDEIEADALLDGMEARVRQSVGQYVYSDRKDEDIGSHVADLLQGSGLKLLLMEQNTEGRIAERLRAASGGQELLEAEDAKAGLSRQLRDLLPADSEKEDLSAALDRYSEALNGLREDLLCLVVVGSTDPRQGVYQPDRGRTQVLFKHGERERRLELNFGGTDELTATWIGNRCFDMIRRSILDSV